jgi:hypothetical protein
MKFEVIGQTPERSTKEDLHKLHEKLVHLIMKYGERFRKEHGEWVKLELDGKKFLQLDTWNKNPELKMGSGEYEFWTGFSPRAALINFGIDFGGFQTYATENQYRETIKDIEALYGK